MLRLIIIMAVAISLIAYVRGIISAQTDVVVISTILLVINSFLLGAVWRDFK